MKRALLPPAGLFWTLVLGAAAALATPYVVLGWSLAGASIAGLYALSTPFARRLLMATLDRHEPLHELLPRDLAAAGAIVVLDGGVKLGAREYGGPTVRPATLERLVYGAWLHRRLGAPILVSGNGSQELMADVLRELGIETRWIEPRSHNTHENAVETAKILRGEGVVRVLLVTHFWHMPRAAAAFAATGLEVVSAPMGFGGPPHARGVLGLLPQPEAMAESCLAVHEWVGILWYRLRYRHARP